jgi:hypothetical protein
MAFLDFMKEKPAQAQQPVAKTSQPEPAKAVSQIPDSAKAQAVEAAASTKALLEKATQHLNAPASQPGANDNPQVAALMQKQSGQEKAQAPMSPTTEARGQVARGRGRSL